MSEVSQDVSFKSLFSPLTTRKVINIMIVIGFIVNFNMLFNNFVWDDISYIIQNPQIHSFNLNTIFGPSMFNDWLAGYYRPLPALYYSFIYVLFQDSTLAYHLPQLILHIINSILLYIFLKKFFNSYLSLFLSIVFLIHPIQVESVAYVSQIDSPLFFFFGITALLLNTKAVQSLKRIALIFTLLLLSLLTKETGILFLFMIFLYRFLFKRKRIVLYVISGFTTLLFYFLLRFGIGQVYFAKITLATPIGNLNFNQHLINIPMIVFYYIKTIFLPLQLAVDQKWIITKVTFDSFYAPLIFDVVFFATLLLFAFFIYKFNRKLLSTYLFFFLWFILGLGMLIQIFSLDMTIADRWMYFPLAGLLGLLGVLLKSLKDINVNLKKAGYIFAITVIILLSVRTIIRNANWYDEMTLYSHDIKIYDSYELENYLGVDYLTIGDYPTALFHFKKSVAMFPYEINLQNMAAAYGGMGDTKDAIKYYKLALSAKSYAPFPHKHSILTYHDYATVLVLSNNQKAADDFIESALQDYPDTTDSDLWKYLALTKTRLNDRQAATFAIQRAHQLNPTDPMTNYIYTNILAGKPFSLDIGGKKYNYFFRSTL